MGCNWGSIQDIEMSLRFFSVVWWPAMLKGLHYKFICHESKELECTYYLGEYQVLLQRDPPDIMGFDISPYYLSRYSTYAMYQVLLILKIV